MYVPDFFNKSHAEVFILSVLTLHYVGEDTLSGAGYCPVTLVPVWSFTVMPVTALVKTLTDIFRRNQKPDSFAISLILATRFPRSF